LNVLKKETSQIEGEISKNKLGHENEQLENYEIPKIKADLEAVKRKQNTANFIDSTERYKKLVVDKIVLEERKRREEKVLKLQQEIEEQQIAQKAFDDSQHMLQQTNEEHKNYTTALIKQREELKVKNEKLEDNKHHRQILRKAKLEAEQGVVKETMKNVAVNHELDITREEIPIIQEQIGETLRNISKAQVHTKQAQEQIRKEEDLHAAQMENIKETEKFII
jgi:hypothetical protein